MSSCQVPPFLKIWLKAQTPLQKRGCTLWYLQQITLKVVYTIFTANFWKLIAICDLWWLNSRSELDISIWTLWRSLHQSVHKVGRLLKSQNIYFWNIIQVLRANLNIQLNCSNKMSFHPYKNKPCLNWVKPRFCNFCYFNQALTE